MLNKISKEIDYCLIGILFLCMYFTGPLYQVNLIGIKILPFDFAIVGITIFVILRMLKEKTLKYNIISFPKILLISFCLFATMMSLDILRVPAHLSVLTLLIATIRNFVFSWIIINLVLRTKINQEQIMSLVTCITTAVSFVSIIAYFIYSISLAKIQMMPSLWHLGIWYYLSEGKFLRLSGLASDPNFFIAVSIVGFIFSLLLFNKNNLQKIMSFIIFIALVLTISKIFLVLLVGSFMGLLAIYIIKKQKYILDILRNFLTIVIISSVVLLIIGIMFPKVNVYKMYTSRISTEVAYTNNPEAIDTRSSLWKVGYETYLEHPVTGSGGKAILFKRGMYVHNDYLEMMSSYGIIGLMILLFFLFSNLFVSFKYLYSRLLLAPFLSIFCYVGFMMGFSVFFNPYFFFPLGIMWSQIILLKKQE